MTTPASKTHTRYFYTKECRYNGIQEGFNGEQFEVYTDLQTGCTFMVNKAKGETLASQLEECRKRFREARQ